MKKYLLLTVSALLLAGCPCAPLHVGMVVNMPIADSIFNANAWAGVERAHGALDVAACRWENEDFSDYEPGIAHFVNRGFGMIVTVGFEVAEAAQAAAQAHPDRTFICMDHAYGDDGIPNLAGAIFDTGQATQLAGYLAAGMTQTGIVGVLGGMDIPPIHDFFDGFAAGVARYNADHGAAVEAAGLDSFVGSFDDEEATRALAQSLLDGGVDILMPVTGDGLYGALDAVVETPDTLFIGVDTDWYEVAPEHGDVILTSVLKRLDVAIFAMICEVLDVAFDGTDYTGTLANGGVDLAPFHELDAAVPEALRQELEALRHDIETEE